jgi:hypothetical protein
MSPSEASGKVEYSDDDLRVIVQDWDDTDPDQAVAINLAEELLKQRERADKFMWQVRDTCQRAEAAEARVRELGEAIHNLSATYDGIWIRISDGEAYALNVAWNKIYAALAARQASAKGGAG